MTLPRWKPGDPLRAADLNLLVDAISSRIAVGPGLTMQRLGGNVAIGLDGIPGSRAVREGVRAILLSEDADGERLNCAILSADGEQLRQVVAARPRDLQKSYWDGQTLNGVTYTAVDNNNRTGDDGSSESVLPIYLAGISELTLVKIPAGTGLAEDPVVVDPDTGETAEPPVLWQDVTPRIWSGSGSPLVYCRFEMVGNETPSHNTNFTVPFNSGDEVENVGGGFEITGTSTIKVLAPAAGKLVRIEAQVRFTDGAGTRLNAAFQCRVLGLPRRCGVTEQGVDNLLDPNTFGVGAHGHESPFTSGAERLFNFGGEFRLSLDDEFYLQVKQVNAKSETIQLTQLDTWITARVLD